jgi:hypothetical protein
MNAQRMSRRHFMGAASAGTLATVASGTIPAFGNLTGSARKLAVQGGQPVRSKRWPTWPVWDRSAEEPVLAILRSGNWFRGQGKTVTQFEEAYARLLGAKRCVCTVNGTNSLQTAMHVLDIGVGDEVIVSPYTFIATYNVVLNLMRAAGVRRHRSGDLPDQSRQDRERITERTRGPSCRCTSWACRADMDRINAIAKKHNLAGHRGRLPGVAGPVAGQEMRHARRSGLLQLPELQTPACGEGGAVIGDDEELMDRLHSYHNCGRAYGSMPKASGYPIVGNNRRMTEYQAAILLSQMKRLEADTRLRWENGQYLTPRSSRACPASPRTDCTKASRARCTTCIPSATERALQQRAPREVHGCAAGRGRTVQRRLRSPVQRRFDRGSPDLQGLPAQLLQGPARPLPRRAEVPRQRPALPGGGVDQPGACCSRASRTWTTSPTPSRKSVRTATSWRSLD